MATPNGKVYGISNNLWEPFPIWEFNPTDGSAVQLNIPANVRSFEGLSTVPYQLTSTQLFALGKEFQGGDWYLFMVDLVDETLTKIDTRFATLR